MWIVINALWIYNLTVETGHFAVLRRAFSSVSTDIRIQVIMIAFCFGALLEALAGFGTPVAICGVMLVALGLSSRSRRPPWPAGRHRPGGLRRDRDPDRHPGPGQRAAQARPQRMVGRQMPDPGLLLPFLLVTMVSGPRGAAGGVAGGADRRRLTFAVVQFVTSNYISPELTDILASLASAAALRRADAGVAARPAGDRGTGQ